jgi:hypothetical protein
MDFFASRNILCFLGMGLLFCSAAAVAGPPFVTDDPETLDYQHWEINLASTHTLAAGGWSGAVALADCNYGLLPNLQLNLMAPVTYNAPSTESGYFGEGDIALAVKYRFLQETGNLPQAAFYPQLNLPAGSESKGLGTGHLGAFLPLWLQKSFGDWTYFGGGGYTINPGPGNENWGTVGVAAQRQVTKTFALGSEIYHVTPAAAGGRADTAFNIGTTIDFNEVHHLLFSIGRSIDGPTRFQLYIAWQFTFGPGEHSGG